MAGVDHIIYKAYQKFNMQVVFKGLNVKLLIMFLLLSYFLFSDLVFRENIYAAYTRLIPLGIIILIFVIRFIGPNKSKIIPVLYHACLMSALLMMYGKCLVQMNDALASSVSGTIVVIFLISLELKTDWKFSTLIYGLPTLVFLILIIWVFELNREQYITLSNIVPMIMLGLFISIGQNRLKYQSFEQNWLLKKEKELTDQQARELTVSEKELKLVNDTKDRFFSIIAHDLRSPYTILLGYSKLLIHEIYNDNKPEIERISRLIHNSAQNNFDLLDNLLQWSSLQQKRINFNPSLIKLDYCITQIELLFTPILCKKDIALINNTPTKLEMQGDCFMLETVLRNLVSNAIKFTARGGKIELLAEQNKEQTMIKIKDNGVGMSEEDLEGLFKIDKHIKSKGTEDETGTGLGLILCHEFINYHSGSISVESELGEGSCFSIIIPN